MCTASIGQFCGCQLTSGLPQHAECCHDQHQCHGPLSRVHAETALRVCSCPVSGQFRGDPTLTSLHAHSLAQSAASHHLEQDGISLAACRWALTHLPHVENTSCCGLGCLGCLPYSSPYLYSAQ